MRSGSRILGMKHPDTGLLSRGSPGVGGDLHVYSGTKSKPSLCASRLACWSTHPRTALVWLPRGLMTTVMSTNDFCYLLLMTIDRHRCEQGYPGKWESWQPIEERAWFSVFPLKRDLPGNRGCFWGRELGSREPWGRFYFWLFAFLLLWSFFIMCMY